ncbi:hypothetical protein [Paraburkholderia pallida]|uniref:Uncharacterized protein n=1 Tax=Paraburkholderia pallida TaxID=2547399 RepID=A0A4P7CUA0_9BURK|nr:hypothetical protein [Paraburkholderia pallida]QBQ99648.1 hypothetical protein E1956_21065 [Paraburkholderia pallida]
MGGREKNERKRKRAKQMARWVMGYDEAALWSAPDRRGLLIATLDFPMRKLAAPVPTTRAMPHGPAPPSLSI